MAFKKMTEYNEAKFGNFFRLVNDKDYADVIFLYRSTQDVLVADAHYVKTPDYSGYVQCLERGCPACSDGIRIQSKLFIPMLVLAHSDPDFSGPKIQFWDRSMRFQPQLMNDVFRNYPDPSEMIFRVTRHGAAGSVDTYYTIQVMQHVPERFGTFEQILADNNIVFPDCYEMVCKDYSSFELRTMLSAPKDGSATARSTYGATPRGSYAAASVSQTAEVNSAVTAPTPAYEYVSPGFAASDTEIEIPAPAPDVDSLAVDEIEDNVDF
jgi:hypothetical protein